jgi:hypothetical protein
VKKENPSAAGLSREHLPSSKKDAIWSAYVEVFASGVDFGKGRFDSSDEIGRQLATNWVQVGRRDQPACHGRGERGRNEQNHQNAEYTATHFSM